MTTEREMWETIKERYGWDSISFEDYQKLMRAKFHEVRTASLPPDFYEMQRGSVVALPSNSRFMSAKLISSSGEKEL